MQTKKKCVKKTTTQMAFDAYKRKYDTRGELKDYGYRKNLAHVYNVIQIFINQVGPNFPVQKITLEHLQEWAAKLKKKPATLCAYARRLSGMLAHAQETF